MAFKRVGIVFNFRGDTAGTLAQALYTRLVKNWDCWIASTETDEAIQREVSGTDVLVTVGGDGTILKTFRVVLPLSLPSLSVNTGRVGFMTEIDGSVAMSHVPRYLASNSLRVERRATITAEVLAGGDGKTRWAKFHALNDIVVGRREVARVAQVEAKIDGSLVTTYRADSVIVATATGSTGYALACGGPIMFPESDELLLVPVSPHLSLGNPLLIRSEGVVELKLTSEYPGLASADGQMDIALERGDIVRVTKGQATALFLRDSEPAAFYANLTQRLHMR